MYNLNRKKLNSLFAKAQWKRRKTILRLQKKGVDNADKILPKINKCEFTEVYMRIRVLNRTTGYKRNTFKDTMNAFLQVRTYKQWQALKRGSWYQNKKRDYEKAMENAVAKGKDPSEIEDFLPDMSEFLYTEKGGRAIDLAMSDMNEELKAKGIDDSYERAKQIARSFMGSD